jgi:PiT family inorganic phosphate transporter
MNSSTLLSAAVVILAYTNGGNDNFKGVATLHGSGTLGYRPALALATAATFLGSLAAFWLAAGLLRTFSGQGLVPDAVAADPRFSTAVALGAGLTVLAATRLGFPVSTTHALTGALAGAGLVEAGAGVSLGRLGGTFVAPLVVSPLLAAGLAALTHGRLRAGALGTARARAERHAGSAGGLAAGRFLDGCHGLSAAAVSFARGVSDTPKIAALLLPAATLDPNLAAPLLGAVMAVGGALGARRVAETMSRRITPMTRVEGFAGSLTTALLVLLASRLGLPVSTTHVSCGALFGMGAVSGRARWRTIRQIGLAWVSTLPIAALLGAGAALFLAW